MTHIFISYARDDLEAEDGILKQLITRLRHNFTIWLDQVDITPGTNWKEALRDAVKTSQALVFLMSPGSAASQYCEAELDAARDAKIPIIPYVYKETAFPFGLSSTNAIFHDNDRNPQQKLEDALREHAPEAYIHGTSQLVARGYLHDRETTFAAAADDIPQALRFTAMVGDTDVPLIGLPLTSTTFCSSYLFGRADDHLGWTGRVQLALQFSGDYRSSRFPVQIAQHFLTHDGADTHLRLLVIYGPPQLVYDQRKEGFSLMHTLAPPSDDENQWADAVKAVQKTLRVYDDGRDSSQLQIFAQGPVAGILYELGAAHRGLHYKAEHYHYDRDTRGYHRVLGSID